MADSDSLLAHLIPRLPVSTENAAVEALGYILRSDVAKDALRSLIYDSGIAVEGISEVATQAQEDGARPDLIGFDRSRAKRIIIEAKFDADLTKNQPNEYLNQLPDEGPSVLLFLAPERRLDNLWNELERKIEAGNALGNAVQNRLMRCTTVGNKGKHLMLVSWNSLLGGLAVAVGESGIQAENIRQLQGLAERMDREAFLPFRGDDFSPELGRRMIHFRDILGDVRRKCVDLGWSISNQPTGGHSGLGWHSVISGNECWFGLYYTMWARIDTPDTPLWIQLYGCNQNAMDKLSAILGLRAYTAPDGGINYVPLHLKAHAEYQEVVDDLVLKLERMVEVIANASQL